MKPCEVKKDSDLEKLKRDNIETGNAWVQFNHADSVVICNQVTGQEPTGKVFLTRKQFQKIVDWWTS
jgi:hypothetical protein